MLTSDTIFALSSARGRAGVSVFRVSGPMAPEVTEVLTGKARPLPRRAALRELKTAQGQLIDKAIVIWFEAPASFTGEHVAEFHIHGGPSIIAELTAELSRIPQLRPAEPGEFTRQAFSNGKLDLTEAEGLADLIAAETGEQRRLALRQMSGELKGLYEDWRHRLIRVGAHVEACIDFADEDIPQGLIPQVYANVSDLLVSIKAHLADQRRGEIIRDGFTIVILGPPNVGKSSLLNAIAKRDVAIVSSIPGTTRDPVEVHLDLAGYAVTLIDTAGLRETQDEIESEGIRRAYAKAAAADMKLAVRSYFGDGVDSHETEALAACDALILNKADLARPEQLAQPATGAKQFHVSAKSGQGIATLISWLEQQVVSRVGTSESMPMTRARHRQSLETVTHCLERFVSNDKNAEQELDLRAEDLRLASQAMGRITGRIDVEDYLDVIFKDFCIGK